MRANSLYFKTPKYLKTCVCIRTSGDGRDWISSFTNQAKLFTKNLFVDDFGNHSISKYHSILQEKLLQKAHCFDFFNNTQNKQRIPYKQPQ